ncbi:YbaB/EbfC family nucleoid-associated protein [Helicobacter heilmannii]|uniref:YbaB/EbfC family nucleoid-associated protein n=1 Tax=Helicobacter heilmannii TaxID=35817 RepID=UPI000CF09069|nr:YbaB/EbfC family nucleoid-associated protein [Helicobacter heilmannii]GMB94269.1 Transcriptional regulatory protein [Helicobacter heilmannii]
MLDFSQFGGLLSSLQEQIKEMENKSKETAFEAKSGGGLVKVKFNGAGELLDIFIDDGLLEDKEALQIYLMSALNEAYKQVEDARKNAAFGMLGGINPFAK